jgi:F-type H+-transporting ATPase subunit b
VSNVKLSAALAFAGLAAVAAPAFADEHEAQHAAGAQTEAQHGATAASAEHGAPGEHGGGEHGAPAIDATRLAAQLVNFALLIGILYFAARKPVSQALLARHQQLKSELAAAAEVRAAAQARLEKQEKRLAALEHEIADIKTGIKQEAEAEKVRLIAAAEERARRIRDEAKFMIDQQVKEAEVELRREAARAAVEAAERMVRANFGAADQQRLIDTFVADVAGNGRHVSSPTPTPAPANPATPRSQV